MKKTRFGANLLLSSPITQRLLVFGQILFKVVLSNPFGILFALPLILWLVMLNDVLVIGILPLSGMTLGLLVGWLAMNFPRIYRLPKYYGC